MKNRRSIMKTLTALLLALCTIWSGLPEEAFAAENATQTKYPTINDFQQARWMEIQSEVFETKDQSPIESVFYGGEELNGYLDNGVYRVKTGNSFFNWVDSNVLTAIGVEAWDGSSKEVPTSGKETYTYEDTYTDWTDASGTEVTSSVEIEYEVYDVGTAAELRWVMNLVEKTTTGKNIKINLTNDINLNGEEQTWTPVISQAASGAAKWIYLEGNGHTIYNMRANDSGDKVGFFGYVYRSTLIVKNLNFQSAMILADTDTRNNSFAGTLYGYAYTSGVCLYNVHANGGYVYGTGEYVAGLTGPSHSYVLMKNCSSSEYYIYGASHTAGMASWTANPYAGNAKVRYDADFPEVPETYLDPNSLAYTSIIEDCYSTDCTVFSVSEAADSGGFISCVAALVIRNCFTNNVIYGNEETGDFVGRVNTQSSIASTRYSYYDDYGNRSVGTYFESCYSSGMVEGEKHLGGFEGYNGANQGAIFKNCYSTAMVGMDYGKQYLGGFTGRDSGQCTSMYLNIEGVKTQVIGTYYLNCYAAGEVGNILTNTDVETASEDYTGGFSGYSIYYQGTIAQTYVNCYYDMQTTAMRERTNGRSGTVDGVAGVYTLGSSQKDVQGLTYSATLPSVDMGDDDIWVYEEGYYPQLKVFTNTSFDVETETGDKYRYSVPISDWLVTGYADGTADTAARSMDCSRTAANYSKASVSTVFLDHWDSIMDRSTGAVAGENDWVCGISQNKLTYNPDTGYWEITYENVAKGTYELKIQEGTSWAYNYGSDGFNGGNCVLSLDEISDVKISFKYEGSIVSDGGKYTSYEILAEITPQSGNSYTVTLGSGEIPEEQEWVLTGTTKLTGSNWDTTALVMTDNGDGTFSYTIDGVEGGYNYGFAVVPKGNTKDTGTNHFFYLKSEEEGGLASYKLVFTYFADDDNADVKVYAGSAASSGDGSAAGDGSSSGDGSAAGDGSLSGDGSVDGDGSSSGDGSVAGDGSSSGDGSVDGDGSSSGDGSVAGDGSSSGDGSAAGDGSSSGDGSADDDSTGNADSGTEAELTDTCLEVHPRQGDGLIEFYTVAGDEALTGYNWLGQDEDTEVYKQDAIDAGRMTYNELTGKYEKTYYNIPVGTGNDVYSYSFKVVANGTWDYGIDYGEKGANYVLQLQAKSDDYNRCNVTISFDPETEEVSVTTNPDSVAVVDESSFEWYIAGEYLLVSNDAYTSAREVYDTVRDIVSKFTFTSAEYTSWMVDESRNAIEEYYEQFAEGQVFTIPYTVDGTTVHGEFGGNVLTLEAEDTGNVTLYSVSDFMPGKSWVQVNYGTEEERENGIVGSRRLRLIPTAYLEAGTNSNIEIFYTEDDNILSNEVKFVNTSEKLTFTDMAGKSFSYYNLALGAGYAITDKVGLGIYANYSQPKLQEYDTAELRDDDDSDARLAGVYYSMYSAYNESAGYNDTGTLSVDTLIDQALIGSSYGEAATIVKVYSVSEDSSGNVTYSKIFMSSSESNSAYYENYLKWTGQQMFDYEDAGEYLVSFYWLLSDGRYLSDSKSVRVTYDSGSLEVSKEVTGSGGETGRSFLFSVTLDDQNINGVYGNMNFDYGTATFLLKAGETVTALGIPQGTSYTVTELGAEDYTTTITDADGGTVQAKTLEGMIVREEDAITFVNHKDGTTGQDSGKTDQGTKETDSRTEETSEQDGAGAVKITAAETKDRTDPPYFVLLLGAAAGMMAVGAHRKRKMLCRRHSAGRS